jgi:hypothetical protein
MRYFEIIGETRLDEGRDAPLYHGSGLVGAASIIKGNEIWGATQHEITALNNMGRGDPMEDHPTMFGVSLSRNIRIARGFGDVVFELDQRKLAQTYKIIPHDYWSAGNPHSKKLSKRAQSTEKENGDRYEYEEFVLGSIMPLKRYLTAIHITTKVFNTFEESKKRRPEMSTCVSLVLNHPLLKVDGKLLVNNEI